MLLTHQVARLLDRTPAAVREMERTGRLKAVRVGNVRLFEREDVQRLLRARDGQETQRQK